MYAKFIITLVFLLSIAGVHAQHFWATVGSSPGAIFGINVYCPCPDCVDYDYIGTPPEGLWHGFSVSPNGSIYGLTFQNDIYLIDPTTGAGTLVLDLPMNLDNYRFNGLAFVTDEICYSIEATGLLDSLYTINIVTGETTNVGGLTEPSTIGDITFFNGDLYYETHTNLDYGIARIILSDPIVNDLVVDLPDIGFHPLTAFTQCHTLVSQNAGSEDFVLINLLDGDIVYISNTIQYILGLSSLLEYEIPGCVVSLDLDCNDTSGADGPDFNSPDFTCISTDGVPICDEDVLLFYDTLFDFIQIELDGFVPDGVNEYLVLEQSYPGLTISGSGTSSILIQNDGNAASTYFKLALRTITYFNDAVIPTLGTRNVRVNATTFYGTETNEGIAYVNVAPWPSYGLDLGPDLEVCDGEEIIINTDLQDVEYQWSTNETEQFITVTQSGEYSVTVTGDEFCSNRDTIEVTFIPSVEVSLGDDDVICNGEDAVLFIENSSDIPLTIEILSTPGDTITLSGVTDETEVYLSIQETTSFLLLSVTAAQPFCLEIEDDEQVFEVLPTYLDTIPAGICEGDSFLIAPGEYVYQPGLYTVYETTQDGCDSIITYNLQLSTSINIQIETNTCIAADTGVFIQIIDNPVGCDTLMETHVMLGELDTTFITGMTCLSGGEGIFTETLESIDGCDSVVVRNVVLTPPQDTSWINQISCDTNAQGIFHFLFPNQGGCDSLVILTVSDGTPDTTAVSSTSCNSAEWGVFETLLQNQYQCDSLVITTVSEGLSDTVYLFRTSCDSAFLGVHETLFIDAQGCDSLVIETITYAEKDTTYTAGTTCDMDESGTFITSFINQFGCDSIHIATISFQPSHHQTIQLGSCMVSDTGTFVQQLVNQFGCDSIVTTIVELWPSHFLDFEEETCLLSDTGTFVNIFQNQFGCDSIVTNHVRLSSLDTTLVSTTTCIPEEAGVFEEWLTAQDGCDSLVVTEISFALSTVGINILSDYNSYPISCFGSSDGTISASASGTGPFAFQWSTNSTETIINELIAGEYIVTVTDGNGCSAISTVNLLAPPPLMTAFVVSMPDCFEQEMGFITANPSGGIPPYMYSLDGIHFQSSNTFTSLEEGTYEIIVSDANQCTSSTFVWVNQVIPVDVSLGDNIEISIGDTAVLEAIVNIPVDSIGNVNWNGLVDTDCPTCLTQQVFPIVTTSYSIEVVSVDGCSDRDTMIVSVAHGSTIYIPNVFSPNGDGQNDVLVFYTGDEIEMISSFAIYDRWGGNMFLQENRAPGDPMLFWDGTSKGSPCMPGVYVYRLVAILNNQDKVIRTGDLTLLR